MKVWELLSICFAYRQRTNMRYVYNADWHSRYESQEQKSRLRQNKIKISSTEILERHNRQPHSNLKVRLYHNLN